MRTAARRSRPNRDEIEFSSPRAAIEAFVKDGWHEEIRRRLAARYQRTRGSAAVEEAVGHALEKAIGELRSRNIRQLYSFVLTAAERRLLDGARHEKRAAAHGWVHATHSETIGTVTVATEESVESAWVDRDARAQAREAYAVLVDKVE